MRAAFSRRLALWLGLVSVPAGLCADEALAQRFVRPDSLPAAEAWSPSADTSGPAPPTIPARPTRLNASGFVRFYGQYRRHVDTAPGYDRTAVNGANLAIGGFSRDPTLFLSFGGQPTEGSYVRAEYALFTPLAGDAAAQRTVQDTANAVASPFVNLYQTLHLTGSVRTDVGTFALTAGGLSWHRVSPLTFWGYEPATYRIFDREPWTPSGTGADRYLGYYNAGVVGRDQRFGRQPVAGFIVEGSGLPGGFSAMGVFGKSSFSGGQGTSTLQYPRTLGLGRIGRQWGRASLGVNAFGQFGNTGNTGVSTTSFRPEGQRIVTVDGRFGYGRITGYAEAGAGRYYSPTYGSMWSPAFILEVNAPRRAELRVPLGGLRELVLSAKVPLQLQAYHIGESVVNFNGMFFNTAVAEAGARYGDVRVEGSTLGSGVSEVGQMANNRQGVSVRSGFETGALKVNVGLETARDLVALRDLHANRGLDDASITSSIAFGHPMGSEVRSEFDPFSSNGGPYGRLLNYFRYTLEQIPLLGPDRLDRKGYNNAELQVKHRFDLFGRPFIQTYHGTYHSVQKNVRALPALDEQTYVRTSYQEVGLYYVIERRLSVLSVAGYERNLSSLQAAPLVAPSAVPGDADYQRRAAINQTGRMLGVGVDYDFGNRIGLYARVRRLWHSDPQFVLDRFDAWQSTLELKAFF